jgi:hypothetical protein
LAAADFQMTGEFLFGHQVDFGARRITWRVHADVGISTDRGGVGWGWGW